MLRYKNTIKRDSLKKWFHSPIQTYEGSVKDETGKFITHGHFTHQVYNDIQKILSKHNYRIDNKKAFKNELVRYLYKLSDDNAL
jgi:hypothetical protein